MASKYNWPKGERKSWLERGKTMKSGIPVIILPLIIIGGTSSGMFTATESAAIACMFAVMLIFVVYRNFSVKEIPGILVGTARDFSLTMFALASAGITGWLVAFLGAPALIAGWIFGITDSYLGVYLLLLAFLFIVGTTLSPITIIIIFMPIIQELGAAVNINDVHLGIVVILTLSLGLVTPPYGSCLMIVSQIGGIPIMRAFASVMPIVLLMMALIIVGVIFPELFLFLPRLMVPAAFPS